MTKNNELPALLDFYADWCAPCKAMFPVIEALAKKYEGKLEIKKINVDERPDLAELYNVRSIPTIVLLNTDGIEDARGIGAKSQMMLERVIDSLLEKERVQDERAKREEAEKLVAG